MSALRRLDGPRAEYRRQALEALAMRRAARRNALPERERDAEARARELIARKRAAQQ